MTHEDLEEKADSVTQLINDEAVLRTAPATPGLLKIECTGTDSGFSSGRDIKKKNGFLC